MAKAGPDTYGGENQGGFSSDSSPIYGYSHMHDSGTGGSPSLGNFPIFAQSGCPNDDINACNYTKTFAVFASTSSFYCSIEGEHISLIS